MAAERHISRSPHRRVTKGDAGGDYMVLIRILEEDFGSVG